MLRLVFDTAALRNRTTTAQSANRSGHQRRTLIRSSGIARTAYLHQYLSGLGNHSGGFPVGYPVGEILVRSHKTLYSKTGATLRRGTLRVGKTSLGAQQNIIIRNLRFRDLWVFDPIGNYDSYGWDYIHLEEGPVSTASGGLETWQVQSLGPPASQLFFWFLLER